MSITASLIPDVPSNLSEPSTSHLEQPTPSKQVVDDTNAYLTSSNPYEYLASIEFHQTFFCARTQTRVSYIDAGDKNGPLLFYILPSGCSRWVAVFLEGYARSKGVRLVAADRPGQGCTARVPLASRIDTSTAQTLSLMEHLRLGGQKVSFLTHSAGIFFLLPVLQHLLHSPAPTLPAISGGMFLSSPWIPASVSGHKFFPFIPASLATAGHHVIPRVIGSVNWLSSMTDGVGDSLKSVLAISGVSIGAPPSGTPESKRKLDKAAKKEREASLRAHPTADIHPPFAPQSAVFLTSPRMRAWIAEHMGAKVSGELGPELVFTYMSAEGFWGMSQEHALCLGGGVPDGEKGLVRALQAGWEGVGTAWQGQGSTDLMVANYWASGDGMIPLKGRDWFDALMTQTPGIAYERHELGAGAAHDTPISTEEVIGGIFSWVSRHG
ncbi:hypothetical protein HWV62_31905 [Athelia sp. TMB]|nr:hypothetical protein HWV62_31905 [Athelia sp. TMB]